MNPQTPETGSSDHTPLTAASTKRPEVDPFTMAEAPAAKSPASVLMDNSSLKPPKQTSPKDHTDNLMTERVPTADVGNTSSAKTANSRSAPLTVQALSFAASADTERLSVANDQIQTLSAGPDTSSMSMPAPVLPKSTLQLPSSSSRAVATDSIRTAAPWAPPAAALQNSAPLGFLQRPTSSGGIGGFGSGTPASSAAAAQAAQAIHASPTFPEPLPVEALPTFKRAGRAIVNEDSLRQFLDGKSVRAFVGFLLALNEAVLGCKLSEAAIGLSSKQPGLPPPIPTEPSAPLTALVAVLIELSSWIDEIPPVTTALRFGNPAFRTWSARLSEHAEELLCRVLPKELQGAAVELAPYLVDSFGNASRIDYGTGHETTFAALLFCLTRLGVFKQRDAPQLVALVFARYLDLMRRLQTTYWLEPAGSHGVWGLDDYQFLPFLFGSSQLVAHPMIKPKSIHNPDVLEAYSKEYLYLACVQFVKQVKKGPLGETSPMLNDISGVPAWLKVNSGMSKMYMVEVLSKFPIMQHFLFGSILPLEYHGTHPPRVKAAAHGF